MNWIERILAFVQIFFESLPVSSSTHVLLAKVAISKYLKSPVILNESLFFSWHIPSTFVFIAFFINKIRSEQLKIDNNGTKINLIKQAIPGLFYIGFSCIPIALVHIFFNTKFSLGLSKFLVFGFLFSGTGLMMLKFVQKGSKRWSGINLTDSMICGLAQLASLIPGVSRMATTTICFSAIGYKAQDTLILSVLQQTFLTTAMICKILVLKPSLFLNIFHLSLADILTISIASLFGLLNLYLTENILQKRLMQIFFAYYLVLSLLILTLSLQ